MCFLYGSTTASNISNGVLAATVGFSAIRRTGDVGDAGCGVKSL